MATITVKDLINRHVQQTQVVTENTVDIKIGADNLDEDEKRVYTALSMGVVTEKVLRDRRVGR